MGRAPGCMPCAQGRRAQGRVGGTLPWDGQKGAGIDDAHAYLIDDLSRPDGATARGPRWALVSDAVMGGISAGSLVREAVDGRMALRLRGNVRLENNGGFLQMATDLAPGGGVLDARGWDGLRVTLWGNRAEYGLHLRTSELARPWQSYRAQVASARHWQVFDLPFDAFVAHRTDVPLNLARLRRIGIVAIGAAFEADVALADLRLYRAP